MKKGDWAVLCTLYINEHLKEDLSVEALSTWAGYSPWYFSRCFKEQVGVSPMEFIKQRRLLAAAGEIAGGCRILDAALDYGWETHGGFAKAFISQFGYSPVFLRAFHIRDVSLKGEAMGLSIKNTELHKEPEELFAMLLNTLNENGTEYEPEKLRNLYTKAFEFHQKQKRYSGEEYITHPLNVSIILADMGADFETVCAGLLHDAVDLEVEERIRDVLDSFEAFKKTGKCTDDNGALVALADRLHNMRTIEFVDPFTWKKRAEETIKIFSPLAAKYGDIRLRAELDDLSLKHLSS
jgi:AraC-like DNA-binding protein